MTDGLKDAHREAIIAALAANDRVERAVLFGSRATGTNTVSSDVDIALFGARLTLTDQARLAAALDEIPMAQSVDLLLYDSIQNGTLREHIRNQGIEWFVRSMATRSSLVSPSFDASGNWSTMPFSDLVFFQEGPGIRNWQYRTRGVPFVNIRCLVNGRLDVGAMNCLDPREVQEKYRHFLLDEGDYVVSSSGTIGRIAEVCREDLPCMLNTSVIRMRPRDDKTLDRRFLRYFLTSSEFQDQIRSLASGSVQVNYGPTHLEQVSILVPPHSEQRSIGHILGTLDDKIELNRRMNATLEAMARALFRSWFVDFDPVRAKMEGRDTGLPKEIAALFPDRLVDSELGDIPEGWESTRLDGVATITKGRSYRRRELVASDTALVTLKSFARGGGYRAEGLKPFGGVYKSEQVVEPGEVIVACTDVTQAAEVVGRSAIVGETSAFRTLVASLDVLIVRPKNRALGRAFVYYVTGTEDFVAHALARTTGTTVLHLSKDAVASFRFALPPRALMERFGHCADSLRGRIQTNALAVGLLAALRDTLLPKLVSGKVRVDGLEPASVREDRPGPVGTRQA